MRGGASHPRGAARRGGGRAAVFSVRAASRDIRAGRAGEGGPERVSAGGEGASGTRGGRDSGGGVQWRGGEGSRAAAAALLGEPFAAERRVRGIVRRVIVVAARRRTRCADADVRHRRRRQRQRRGDVGGRCGGTAGGAA